MIETPEFGPTSEVSQGDNAFQKGDPQHKVQNERLAQTCLFQRLWSLAAQRREQAKSRATCYNSTRTYDDNPCGLRLDDPAPIEWPHSHRRIFPSARKRIPRKQ